MRIPKALRQYRKKPSYPCLLKEKIILKNTFMSTHTSLSCGCCWSRLAMLLATAFNRKWPFQRSNGWEFIVVHDGVRKKTTHLFFLAYLNPFPLKPLSVNAMGSGDCFNLLVFIFQLFSVACGNFPPLKNKCHSLPLIFIPIHFFQLSFIYSHSIPLPPTF